MSALGTANDRDIWIYGYYGEGNFGDDLLATYLLTEVCRVVPPQRIAVSAPEGSYLERWFPGAVGVAVPRFFSKPPSLPTKLVFGGGGQFHAFPPATLKNKLGLSNFSTICARPTIGWSRQGLMRMYAFCLGIGPLVGFGARLIASRILASCEHTSVRDTASIELLSKLGIKKVRLVTDPSIWLANTLTPVPRRELAALGIVVRQWPFSGHTHSLIASLQSAAEIIRGRGIDVQFISFQPDYDLHIMRELQKMGEEVRAWIPEQVSIVSFCEYLSRFQVLVTMRAHGVYVASMLGIVPVAILIEPKLKIAAENCGYPDLAIDLNCAPSDVVAAVERAAALSPIVHDWSSDLRALEDETANLCSWLQS